LSKQVTRLSKENMTGGSKLDPAWKSFEQFDADLFLELLYLACQRRLSNMQTFCSFAEMLQLCNMEEIAELS
jgi:hypothetical protein